MSQAVPHWGIGEVHPLALDQGVVVGIVVWRGREGGGGEGGGCVVVGVSLLGIGWLRGGG